VAKLTNQVWPILKSYDRHHLGCIALPLGGIGTGTVSLGGRGDLRDWEIVNRPSKGFVPRYSLFAVYAKAPGSDPVARVLEGPVDGPLDSANGYRGRWYGMPRFRDAEFHGAYPFGQVILRDKLVPLIARIEAFNPLIPCDDEASGLPIAVMRVVLINPTKQPIAASVAGSLNNFVGTDGVRGAPLKNVNELREAPGVQGVFLRSDGVPEMSEQYGTMALATTSATGVSRRAAWFDAGNMFESLTDFWEDLATDGRIEERDGGGKDAPMASVCVSTRVPAGGEKAITFVIAWSFPNRQTWTPEAQGGTYNPFNTGAEQKLVPEDRVGNYYSTLYRDAWDVVERTAPRLPALEKETVRFVKSFCDSDLPEVVKEAALFNLPALRSQTAFRTEDGRFFGWEGCVDQAGCCHGSCTHVWNYDLATPLLFGSLSKSMRDSEFRHATSDDGHMAFRINLPIARARQFEMAAADGQMGCVIKLYRDWQLSGDEQMLRDLWPRARKALEFAWIPGGWDADRDGVMEGVQHNTTDLEFYGPNPLMACWYLGALRAAEEMARYLHEDKFAAGCRELFEKGSGWVDKHLFDGEYYVQELRTPRGPEEVAKGLMGHVFMSGVDVTNPPQQPGNGCMTDQLAGQFLAHACGLGHLLDPAKIAETLKSIMKYNFVEDMYAHLNPIRAFAMQDEKALVYGTFPKGGKPERPCFRFFENWTGVEYAAAVLMLQEGRKADGLKVIKAIRDRFDGRKRNPFDEPECGHHYSRAMASWGAVLALTGFRYSAVDGTLELAGSAAQSTAFWSTGYAWGVVRQKPSAAGVSVALETLGGSLAVGRIVLKGIGACELPSLTVVGAGKKLAAVVARGRKTAKRGKQK
jgi:non-lysosomal glucosylceramidase